MNKPLNNYAFIDSQNLNLGIKACGWNALDFKKFRIYLKEKYSVKNAYLFIGYIPANQNMYTGLQEAGYILIFKPVLPPKSGAKPKGNCDAELVLQAMIEYEKFQGAIIVTRDGDFHCLVKYFYEKHKLEMVLSPSIQNCSILLRQAAKEKINYINDLKDKLEYKKELK